MDISKRLVTQIPLNEIWDQEGPRKAKRGRYLSAEDIAAMLRENPVEFILADVGKPLECVPIDKCFEFWKSEVNVHLINDPERPIQLEEYPGEYAYLASQWSEIMETQIVLLEKYH